MLKENVNLFIYIYTNFLNKEFIEKCKCTEEDWECDFGYYRKLEGSECIP